jgi:hypothetical protein
MTIPIIILYIVCFGLVVWQFFALRQEQREFEAFDHLLEFAKETHGRLMDVETHMNDMERMYKRLSDQSNRTYSRLDNRVTALEKGDK